MNRRNPERNKKNVCVVRRGLWLYNQYTVVSSCFFNAKSHCKQNYFTWKNWIQCAHILHRACVENKYFYPTISKRSCHVQNCTCIQILDINPKLDKHSFQAAFLMLNLIVTKCVLHGKSEYRMRFYCRGTRLHTRWNTGYFIRRYPRDSAMYSTVPASEF